LFYAELFYQKNEEQAISAVKDLVFTKDATKPEAYFRLYGMLLK
jgi:hypothetical protein